MRLCLRPSPSQDAPNPTYNDSVVRLLRISTVAADPIYLTPGLKHFFIKSLFIVRPKPKHFHDVLFFKHLIDETVLHIDSSGIGPGKITH